MAPKNRNRWSAGQILVHTPLPPALCRSQSSGNTSDNRRAITSCNVRGSTLSQGGEKREEWYLGPPRGAWHDWLCHSTVSRLQAKFKSDHQDLRSITHSILDTENGFIKDLEHFLCQQERAELCRRELLHKRWTERVWSPIQKIVENRLSHHRGKELQSSRCGMFMSYMNHCNTKSVVFLENYDPKEYDPSLLNTNRPQYFMVNTPVLKDPLSLQSRERIKEKRAVLYCHTGYNYTRRQVEQLLNHDLPQLTPPIDPMTSHNHLKSADMPLLAPPTDRIAILRDSLVEVKNEPSKPKRHVPTGRQVTDTHDRLLAGNTGCQDK
ncbi:hypothetical protein DPEC_G00081310 [Dallia pectoralis]|uniref:Uncharacterized protein n=1 Tax=Dallia pectoralis TaxID=75939 RepID=A0ACC2GYG9_DALPE|nr:hypothetical protein DPEC_G00081310 [Dallia pectoralis]